MRTLRIVLAVLILVPALGLSPTGASNPERSRYAVEGALPRGAEVLARYGSTAVVDLTEAEAAALKSAGSSLEALPDAHKIKLNRLSFDTRLKLPTIPRDLMSDPTATTWVVQFVGPVEASWLEALRALGAQPSAHGYVPENAWLVRARPESVRLVQRLGFVQAAVPLHPWFRISPRLDRLKGLQQVRVLLAQDAPVTTLAAKIRSLGAVELGRVDDPDVKVLRLNVAAALIPMLARMDGVLWIEPSLPLKLHNDHAADTMGVRPVWGGVAERSGVALQGEGEIVAVADTGLDTGKLSTMHPDFRSHILAMQAFGRPNDPSDADGHGTHTAGSVVGDGSAWADADLAGCMLACDPTKAPMGMAPKAKLVFQSIADAEGALAGVPEDPGELYGAAYDVGARVHSNSYGSDAAGAYDLQAMMLDRFIEKHPDMLITFSAGNSGVDLGLNGIIDLGSIGSPATAKNAMSVGASEDNRGPAFATGDVGDALLGVPAGLSTYTTYALFYIPPAGLPLEIDYMSNNSDGMVAFSSRGPTLDGRIKPDIVGIGTQVLSARTSLLPDRDIELHYWSKASRGSSASQPKAGDYPTSLDKYYAFAGGTSMSNPLTAGAATVVRQYLRQVRGFGDPSAALVKTAMTAGAYELQGQYPGPFRDVDARPDNNEGWGRVDVANTIAPDGSHVYFYDDPIGLRTAATARYEVDVTDTSKPLRVQLGWTDVAANVLALKTLVNDLDMTVTAPDGTIYKGNAFLARQDGITTSRPNPGAANHIDNVEGIQIAPAQLQTGKWTIDVKGHTVPASPQRFALVLQGGIASAPAGAMHLDAASYRTGGRAPKLVVSDPGRNRPGLRDSVTVRVSTASAAAGVPVKLTEDASSEGVFIGDFRLGAPGSASQAAGVVASAHGQRLRATYKDSGGHVLGAEALVDNVAPKVGNTKLMATTPFGFTVGFNSSEPAFGDVDIGFTPSKFTSSATAVAITQDHEITALGLDDAKRYFYRVRATDDPGNVGIDDVGGELFTVRTLRAVLEYAYDAEAETGWTHQQNPDNSAAAADLWHLSSRKDVVHGGKMAWFYGSEDPNTNYAASGDAFLDSPELTRKSSAWAILSFWANYDAEKGFDGLNLLASDDGGASYRTVPILSTSSPTGPGLASAQIDGNSKGYRLIEADLSSFKGQTLRVRFQFTSDTGVEKAGAAVDDISVLGSELAPVRAVLKAASSTDAPDASGVVLGTLTLQPDRDRARIERLVVRRTGSATDQDVPAVILTLPDGSEAVARFSDGVATLDGVAFDGAASAPGKAIVSLKLGASAVAGRTAGLVIDTSSGKAAAPDVIAAGMLRFAQVAISGTTGALPATGVVPLEPVALLLLLAAALGIRGLRARRD